MNRNTDIGLLTDLSSSLGRWYRLCLCAVVFLCLLTSTINADSDPAVLEESRHLLQIPLEELMEIEIESASRQNQKIKELSAPVTVITAEEIHYHGLTNVADILRFAVGVDVFRINRFIYGVGIHGLNDTVSDRVKLMVNGRDADNVMFGGPEFYSLPVLVEDIDRIEIVRGPAGAAWCANTFTGVINIITKKPEDVLGLFTSTTVTEFGDSYTHLRWGKKQDDWRWKISAGYEDVKSSEDVLDGAEYSTSATNPLLLSAMGYSGFVARDFSRTWRFDSEAICDVSEDTELSIGAAASHFESGDYEQQGYFPRLDFRIDAVRSYVKIDRHFDKDTSGYLQWFGNFSNWNLPIYLKSFTAENDFQAQLDFSPWQDHRMSVGGNFRWTYINASVSDPEQYVLTGEPYDEYWSGIFLIDRYDVDDRLTLEGQIRSDWYTGTEWDWSGRLAALYALDDHKDHVVRLAAARAFRRPLVGIRNITADRIENPFVPGTYLVRIIPNEDSLVNEHTHSVEAGYFGKLSDTMTVRADMFYQRYDKLIGFVAVSANEYRTDNYTGADNCGGELEVVMEHTTGRLSAWYSYNGFDTDGDNQNIRSYMPAKHKFGVNELIFLSKNWVLNAAYYFTDCAVKEAVSNPGITPSAHRLDLTVTHLFAKGKGEISFGVFDLLAKTHEAVYDVGTITGHETPGRTFFGRLQIKF